MLQAATPQLILASASTVRQAILAGAGLIFAAQPALVDEAEVKRSAQADDQDAADAALTLAEMKARRIAQREPDALVIGADQILLCEGVWYDKPSDLASARAQLLALRGRMHILATAIACRRNSQTVWHHIARPRLTMRAFSDAFLDDYLAAEQERVLTSVGAYRLEGLGVHLFERIEGDYASILGLPLLPLLRFLRQHGVLGV